MARMQQGFTLLEMLVALTVSVLVAMAGASALQSTRQTMHTYDDITTELRTLRLAMRTMRDDLEQIQRRPIRDEFGTTQAALFANLNTNNNLIAFSKGGWRNPRELKRATIARVVYKLENGELKRGRWNVLDRVLADEPKYTTLLTDVESVTFEFLDSNKRWHRIWPPQSAAAATTSAITDLPNAIKVTFELKELGKLSRIFVGSY